MSKSGLRVTYYTDFACEDVSKVLFFKKDYITSIGIIFSTTLESNSPIGLDVLLTIHTADSNYNIDFKNCLQFAAVDNDWVKEATLLKERLLQELENADHMDIKLAGEMQLSDSENLTLDNQSFTDYFFSKYIKISKD